MALILQYHAVVVVAIYSPNIIASVTFLITLPIHCVCVYYVIPYL